MNRYSGDHRESFALDGSIESVRAHFTDPSNIARHHGDVREWKLLDPKTVEYVLVPKSEKGVTFNGRYSATYGLVSPERFEWRSVGAGNMTVRGSIRFIALGPTRTRVDYEQHIECEMEVNRILGALIAPIVSRQISDGTRRYLERMRAAFAAR